MEKTFGDFWELCARHGLKPEGKQRLSPAAQDARLKRVIRELDENEAKLRPPWEE